jgi:N-acetylmuramoyl-L-alanine amidase
MNMPRKRGLAVVGACAFILALAAPAWAVDASTPVAVGARLAQDANEAQLVFDLSLPVEAHVYALPSPDRIIVDLPEVNFQLNPSVGRPAAPNEAALVKAFRFGVLAPGKSRIVIDLARPACPNEVGSKPIVDGASASRLTIELKPCEAAAFAALELAAAPLVVSPDASPPTPLPVIVLDPGHGGADGAPMDSGAFWKRRSSLNFARSSSGSSKRPADIRLR